MHIKRRRLGGVAAVAGLAVVLAACGGGGGSSKSNTSSGKEGGVFHLGITEPTAIDPYNAQESEGILVTKQLFSGLVTVDKDGNVKPLVADSWTPNNDCTEWTFKLKDKQQFSNGDPVDAQAFIRGMNRAAAKSAASDVAYHMAGIKGFDDVQSGKAQEMSGLSAPDATTLKVALSAPDCEFYKKTYQTVFSPVPASAGAASNKTYNDQPIGNGPFMMKGPWQHNSSITLVKNPKYSLTPAHLDEVDIDILDPNRGINLEYDGFKAGKYDWARIPTELLPQAKGTYGGKGDFIKQFTNGMNYIMPATAFPPLNSVDARQAISYAIDRDAIIAGVFKGFQTKATAILPPVFTDVYQQGLCESCQKQDPAKAKELAAKAGLKPGTKVDFYYNTGAGHDAWVQAVAAQVKEVLGLNVNIVGMPFKQLLEKETEPIGGMYRFAWGADYPTPDNYLFPLLDTKSINLQGGKVTGDNRGRYSNPEFDKLIEQERSAKTDEDRKKYVQQAEQVAMNDMALIPLWIRTQYRVYNSSKWQNVYMDFNENPDLADLSLK